MRTDMTRRVLLLGACVLVLSAGANSQSSPEPGLLFYLSASHGLTADYAAGGDPEPNFASDVQVVADGAKGPGIQCAHTQLLSYKAPGNVYAQRGTVAFSWRSREPVGKTAFPIFRVGYADHSSWDMVWLRIDYNGRSGFDAFVTDASLARTRVSVAMPAFPTPRQWVHLALAWDETRGIRLYVDGRLMAQQEGTAIFDAALDQFGPHSRVISPYQVQSAYNFVRGGDIDEVRIYDRMLSNDNVASLARAETPSVLPALARLLNRPEWREEWWFRHGWNRPGDIPPPLDAPAVTIRKVEIHDAYDLKRWWWKATDGIRETTWPGVFNRSRLAGRNDYFQLPDWDCYSQSGKAVTFSLPDEPWNHIEIAGAAWGTARVVRSAAPTRMGSSAVSFERPRGQERTFHRLPQPIRGQQLEFTNVAQETPIGELGAYFVAAGGEPEGIGRLIYKLTALAEPNQPSVRPALEFVNGRHAPDERATMVALPVGAPRLPRKAAPVGLPVVHVLIPSDLRDVSEGPRRVTYSYSWMNMPGGLDGIALDLPALAVQPTHGQFFPLRIQVKDPNWPLRNMLDVSVSVKPGEPHTLWLDVRDRVLAADRGLYLSIAGAGSDFGASSLEGAEIRLVFKARAAAVAEHVIDRFTQVRDNYAQIVEEQPRTRRLSLYTRFESDITDLLRVDPDHALGRQYWYDYNREQPQPAVAVPSPPAGVPVWAFRQVELLRSIKRFVDWYIDERQIDNGEFGGGLSDDGDLTNVWPGTAFMGAMPEKITRSLLRQMDAFYEQGLFTNGLSTIQTDELHSYEEGIQVLGQSMLLDFGSPKQIERAMVTAAAIERITGINAAGHRHIRSSYFSGTVVSEEGVWGWSKPSSYLILHPAIALVDYNGAPRVRTWLLELADGLLAHRQPDGAGVASVRATVQFATDQDLPGQSERGWPLLWAAFRWTGDRKYIQPLVDAGPRALAGINANALDLLGVRKAWAPQVLSIVKAPTAGDAMRHFAWQASGDRRYLEALYGDQIKAAALREYINTEGSLWIDRVNVPYAEIQRARLGGVALVRNAYVPGHTVSWRFDGPAGDERVAILVPDPTPSRVTIGAYNLDAAPVTAQMSVWDVEPGTWEVIQGTRPDVADGPLAGMTRRSFYLERGAALDVTFAPRTETVIELRLVSKGEPYWRRPDLGIVRDDIRITGRTLSVTVHSLGAVDAPPSRVVLRDREGRVVASAAVPALKAPIDLRSHVATVRLALPANTNWTSGDVTIETVRGGREITLRNNRVRF